MNAAWAKGIVAAALMAVSGAVDAAGQDIVIVFDNSGSMRWNDPHFLARDAVERLVADAGPDDRLALIIFDEDTRLAFPLLSADAANRSRMLGELERIDYRGQWTDIPGAVERALYLLREDGRARGPLDILLLTDGIVDTGDTTRDRDREAWLLDELVPMARSMGVRIFGIAFSDEADFRLIQALASRTNADYARVLEPAALGAAFQRLRRAMEPPPPEPDPLPEPVTEPTTEPPPVVVSPETPADPEPESRSIMWWPWVVALGLALGAAFVILRRRRTDRVAAGAAVPGATLTDLSGVTGNTTHRIDTVVAVFGRKPGDDLGPVTSIVIPQHTVSRLHASIRWRDGQYWLVDHDSANGTFIDDEQVQGEVPLHDGARLRIDTYDFDFSIGAADVTQVRGSEEEEEGEHTIVRGSGASGSTTQFRGDPDDAGGGWDDFDDDVIDDVLTEFEDDRKKDD